MNKVIYDQLKKVAAIELNFDESTTKLFIPKTLKVNNMSLQEGKFYKIRFEDFIINPNKSSTLASNWNAGKVPKHKEYYAEIVGKMANMIKLNGVAVEDQTDNFYGGCPAEGFEVIQE